MEAADREWSWLQWAKEKLRVEVGIKTELAKEVMDKLLSRKQDFATDAVSEGIDAIAKSVGGGGGGGGDKEKWASWMEWGKEKLKQVLEKQSDSAKAQLATAIDAAHDFVESLVDEIGSGEYMQNYYLSLHFFFQYNTSSGTEQRNQCQCTFHIRIMQYIQERPCNSNAKANSQADKIDGRSKGGDEGGGSTPWAT